MKRILLTGMSGTGKSTLIGELSARGYKAVDADTDEWTDLVRTPGTDGVDDEFDLVWREERMQRLLSTEDADVLFVSGCAPNQVKFYPHFDHVVLLSAPAGLMVERLATRTTNPYGQRPDEVARALELKKRVEPLLRSAADLEVDTSVPVDQVVASVLRLLDPSVDRF